MLLRFLKQKLMRSILTLTLFLSSCSDPANTLDPIIEVEFIPEIEYPSKIETIQLKDCKSKQVLTFLSKDGTVNHKYPFPEENKVYDISIINQNDIRLASSNGTMFRLFNQNKWVKYTVDTNFMRIAQLHFFNENFGVAIMAVKGLEAVIYRTYDTGITWELSEIKDFSFEPTFGDFYGSKTVQFLTKKIWFVHGKNTKTGKYEVLKTSDSGKNWNAILETNEYIKTMKWFDENIAIISADLSTFRTKDKGLNWSKERSFTYSCMRNIIFNPNSSKEYIISSYNDSYISTDFGLNHEIIGQNMNRAIFNDDIVWYTRNFDKIIHRYDFKNNLNETLITEIKDIQTAFTIYNDAIICVGTFNK